MIIDAHQHLGICDTFDHNVTEEDVLNTLNTNKIDGTIIFPFPGSMDEKGDHDRIYALTQKYPKRFFGVISLNPHIQKIDYLTEVERLVKLGFKAIKIHPYGHACNPIYKTTDKVFEAANTFNLPVIIHTGIGAPSALPSNAIPRAKQYPHLKIVLAHAGAYIYSIEALITAKECPNIYLEPSWVPAFVIKNFVKEIGAHRVMFGSDILASQASELCKFTSTLSGPELDQCLYGTVKEVFNLSV